MKTISLLFALAFCSPLWANADRPFFCEMYKKYFPEYVILKKGIFRRDALLIKRNTLKEYLIENTDLDFDANYTMNVDPTLFFPDFGPFRAVIFLDGQKHLQCFGNLDDEYMHFNCNNNKNEFSLSYEELGTNVCRRYRPSPVSIHRH